MIASSFRLTMTLTAVMIAVDSKAQAQSPLETRFAELDKNADGKITVEELPRPVLFRLLDSDKDGFVTLDEAKKNFPGEAGAPQAEAKPEAKPEPKPVDVPVRQGPEAVKPGDHGVGRMLPDIAFIGLDGKPRRLSEFKGRKAVVIALTSTSCPISRKYVPTLADLIDKSGEETAWILVNPITTDKAEDIRVAAARFGAEAVYVHDADGAFARALGAEMTTEAFVVDSARTVRYRGSVDDQYGFGYAIETPRFTYLADAINAVVSGHEPAVTATRAPGCVLDTGGDKIVDSEKAPTVTYHARISRIIQRNCLECHREGGSGPFSLENYDDVVAHAAMIKRVVSRGQMPPWFAADEADETKVEGAAHRIWANDRSLGVSEKADLLAWIDGGRAEGDIADAPLPATFPEGWLIGTPDAVFEFAEPIAVKATGVMPYQQVVVETNLTEDKWVRAIEIQPGDRQVVHHALVFVQPPDQDDAAATRNADESDGFWGIYVPGNSTLIYPEGFAKRLPKGSKLRFQMHYTPNGTATTDRTRIGLVYHKRPPKHEVRVAGVVNTRLNIPPGADNHREEAAIRIPADVKVLAFLPHMHLRGKACRYELFQADGSSKMLLDIPRYDFNWQLLYRYAEPLEVKQGDSIRFTAWFDNSDGNPANPDPTKTVKWGPQTYDEMQLGYIEYYVPTDEPGERSTSFGRRPGARASRPQIEAFFERMDRDGDGKLAGDEIPEALRSNLGFIDADSDEAITLEEILKARGRSSN